MQAPGYRLLAELSRNQHTLVYRASRAHDGLPVIVKTLAQEYPPPAQIRRLVFEHRILTRLEGPGVARALELAGPRSRPALILEDFGASDLAARRLPLGLEEFFRAALQLTAAVGRMHALSIIHKDIKPRNLIATDALDRVELIDFQIASEVSRERRDEAAVSLEGSLPYISPEQTGRMNRALDYRSDYYSLGVTLFELLTGELPFSAKDAMGWFHCHISSAPPLAHEIQPGVPRALSAIIDKLMAKEPQRRYQSARGLSADLARCRAERHASGVAALPFALGQADVVEHFSLSEQLVGRGEEAEQLLRVFEAASSGRGKLLLVSGYSGVGKSSLIRELHKPLTAKHGYFTSGKLDQLERRLPYAALAHALRGLIRQLLAETDAELERWRTRLCEVLGGGASVMTELVPELAQLIGPQPAAATLEPAAAQNRFKFALAGLVKALASPERPLVIFLDDLQWSDAATMELLTELFCTHDIHHLLWIGAYRDNEVLDGHFLRMAVQKLEAAAPNALEQIVLAPLSEDAAAEIVAQALRCTPGECSSLTREIYAKTAGNPFFTGELLLSLYREGSLEFEPERARFTCDPEAVKRLPASGNVVDLLMRRLESLDGDALVALRVAACIGDVFSLGTLSELLSRSPDLTARALWAPIREGLIFPLDDEYRLMSLADCATPAPSALDVRYRFQHDRVQQAAYSLMGAEERSELHLGIGRLLLERAGPALATDPFTATNHLNLGFASMKTPSERERLAVLNRAAGERALAATAFTVAAAYYDGAARCLSRMEWEQRPELRFRVHSERALAVLMAGERERAAALVDELFELAPTRADRAAVGLAKCRVMVYQGRASEAIAAVRDGLLPLGIELPSDPVAIEQRIAAGVERMLAQLARVPIDELVHLPDLTDPERAMAMRLLFEVVPPATVYYPPLFVLAELEMFDLGLTHGITAESAKNFVDCGLILGGVLGDFAAAYRLGKVAFQVLERFHAGALACQVHFVFAAYVSPWGAPYAESLASFRESCRLGLEAGDHIHLAFARALELRMLLHLGRHLDECAAEVVSAEALSERIRAAIQRDAVRLVRRAVECLRDPLDDAARSEGLTAQLTQEISDSGNAQWNFQHAQAQMMVNAVLGDWDAAERHSQQAARYQQAASTLFTVPEYHLLEGLIMSRQRWPRADEERRAQLRIELGATLGKLERWAQGQPENFDHKYHLLAAELARIDREPAQRVVALYEAAAASTGRDFLHWRAMALELHARYWLEQGSRSLSAPLLSEALELYAGWGAMAKVRRLERECEQLFDTGPRRFSQELGARGSSVGGPGATLFGTSLLQRLDLGSALQATQAISGEVRSERLFARLMHTILENAAAQHGALILPDESGALVVRARAEAPAGDRDVSASHPLEQETRVCHEVVRVAARTLEPLVIDDAAAHPSFGSLPYVQGGGVKSVLCMPVVHQGVLAAVLYVENRATTHAFTAERVEILRLIAGQAAISITNASLYANLERKVADRTRELAAKTKKIAAMLDGMQQAVFSVDESLTIQPEYSRYLEELATSAKAEPSASGERAFVGRSVSEVLFQGAELGEDVIVRHEGALRFGFGVSVVMAEANAEHLIRSYQRRAADGSVQHLEVDWNWITDEAGRVERVLVTARDVTRLRGLEQEAARAAREATILAEILEAGVENVKKFLESTRELLRGHVDALEAGSIALESARALRRDVHTFKGHCRELGLHRLIEAAHAAEEACSCEPGRDAPEIARRLSAIRALEGALEEYQGLGQRKLGRLWGEALSRVSETLARASAVPLEEVLRESARVFPALARELGKAVPELVCRDTGTWLARGWGQVMRDALVHTLCNSVDHGIEPDEERHAAGKRIQGTIRLSTEPGPEGVLIRLSDDGRGLAVDRLRERTGKLDSSDAAVAEAIFELGVSTAERLSTVSGRGIGMDAVRARLRERGGDVALAFTGEARGGYRPFELVFTLPSHATLAACS